MVGLLLVSGTPDVQREAFAVLAALVLVYPYALGMATPLALIRSGGMAANRGILMRSGDDLQIFKDVTVSMLNKMSRLATRRPFSRSARNPSIR